MGRFAERAGTGVDIGSILTRVVCMASSYGVQQLHGVEEVLRHFAQIRDWLPLVLESADTDVAIAVHYLECMQSSLLELGRHMHVMDSGLKAMMESTQDEIGVALQRLRATSRATGGYSAGSRVSDERHAGG